jgi:hypothetical protein
MAIGMAVCVLFAHVVSSAGDIGDMAEMGGMDMGGMGGMMGGMGGLGGPGAMGGAMGGPGGLGGMGDPVGGGVSKAVESDVKFIQCATCKALVKRAVFRAKEARHLTPVAATEIRPASARWCRCGRRARS